MENNSNSEIHNLITGVISTLRKDFGDRLDKIEAKIESLRPCIVTQKSCEERHKAIDKIINERMVDKTQFKAVVATILVAATVVGAIVAVRGI